MLLKNDTILVTGMQKKLDEYNGIAVGDIVKLNSNYLPKHKRAKVKNIYKEGENIRYVVKVSNGEIINIEASNIKFNNEACNCEITVLMRLGCQCGGY